MKTSSVRAKRIESRKKNWEKFGRAGSVSNSEQSVSYIGDEQIIMWKDQWGEEDDENHEVEKLYKSLTSDDNNIPMMNSSSCNDNRPWRPRTQFHRPFSENLLKVNSTTLKISNLPDECNDDDIRELVRDLGKTTRINLVKNKKTNYSNGIAYVSFLSRDEAVNALNKLNRSSLYHSILNVEEVPTL